MVLFLIMLIGCSASPNSPSNVSNIEATETAIAIINENSDFAGHILLEVYPESIDYGPLTYAPVYDGPCPYFSEPTDTIDFDSDIYGEYGAYPSEINTYKLNKIIINSPQYHVLGVYVGGTLDDAATILIENGFTLSYEGKAMVSYSLHDIHINMDYLDNSHIIETIHISIIDPNRQDDENDGAY